MLVCVEPMRDQHTAVLIDVLPNETSNRRRLLLSFMPSTHFTLDDSDLALQHDQPSLENPVPVACALDSAPKLPTPGSSGEFGHSE